MLFYIQFFHTYYYNLFKHVNFYSIFRWWCHFDDDNYVHVVRLVELLQKYSSLEPAYLGKPSTAKPLEIFEPNILFPVSKITSKAFNDNHSIAGIIITLVLFCIKMIV